MRSNKIKMAYYGILMKDGTELTHYGVKGMKWGKHLFSKVRGLFGKPSAGDNPLSDNNISGAKKKEMGNLGYSLFYGNASNASSGHADQRKKQIDNKAQTKFWRKTAQDIGNMSVYEIPDGNLGTVLKAYNAAKQNSKKAANSVKRNSKRVNGR